MTVTSRWIAAVAMALLWAFLPACANSNAVRSSASAPSAAQLGVLSFNIRYGTANDGENAWAYRREQAIQIIAEHVADIVGLQEALRFQIDEILAALPKYRLIGVGRDDGQSKGEYAAILYNADRFEIVQTPTCVSDVESGTFWFSDTPEVVASKSWGNRITRICTWAHLRERATPDRRIYIYNVHLDHESEPSRVRSAQLLLERIRSRADTRDPVIVTGDFNSGQTSEALRTLMASNPLSAAHAPLADAFAKIHPNEPESATFHAFKGIPMRDEGGVPMPRDPGQRIDAILFTDLPADAAANEHSSTLTPIDAVIDRTSLRGRYPSDHFPIYARFEWCTLSGDPPSSPSPFSP